MAMCTATNNCTDISYCARQSNATPATCPTSGSCTGNQCGNSMVANAQTCFMCGDTCATMMSASTCNTNANCAWQPTCIPMMMSSPCSETSASGCVADSYGCFWIQISESFCGSTQSVSVCQPCNGSMASLIGPLSRMSGQTCTWPAMSPYTKAFSVTLNAFQTAAAGMGGCVAIPAAASPTSDMLTISGFASASTMYTGSPAFAATTTGTCAKASSPASMLSPSLAILGLVAFLTRL